jgi:hypothetical protein
MAIYVNVLERGGCSAYGGASYDSRDRVVRLDVIEGEAFDVTIEYPETPASFDYWEDGIDGSEPVISGDTITLQFQTLTACGTYEIEAAYASGAKRRVKFQANEAQPFISSATTPTDDDDVDYGAWG